METQTLERLDGPPVDRDASRADRRRLFGALWSRRAAQTAFALVLSAVVVAVTGAVGWSVVSSMAPRPTRPLLLAEDEAPVADAVTRRVGEVRWRAVGSSVLGRPILMASFGEGPRRVLVVGGVHGAEYGSDAAPAFAEWLAAHPGDVPAGTAVDVIACADPDGYALGLRGNAEGVDINRNFPSSNWVRAAWRGWSAGPWPGSEPETRALMQILQSRYARVISLHSRGGLVDYDGPGGRILAARVSRACGMPVLHLADRGLYTGTMGIYVPELYGVPVITLELTSPRLTRGVRAGLLAAVR
jgi:murein peptide amidase A